MENKPTIWMGLAIAALMSAVLLALINVGNVVAGLPMLHFSVFDWVARNLPGGLITFGIDAMVDVLLALGLDEADAAKPAERGMAAAGFFMWAVGLATGYIALVRTIEVDINEALGGVLLGVLTGLPLVLLATSVTGFTALGLIWLILLFLVWGGAVSLTYGRLAAISTVSTDEEEPEPAAGMAHQSRRDFLIKVGGATAAITVVGAGVSAALQDGAVEPAVSDDADSPAPEGGDGADTTLEDLPQEISFPNAGAEVERVAGTRPEYTPLDDHYQIDINTVPPTVEGSAWRLTVDGMVDNPREYGIGDLQNNFEQVEQFVTLSCISNRIAGSLISTTLWTGFRLSELLEDVGMQDEAAYLYIQSVDGFYETMALDVLEEDDRVMLAYAWDRQPLKRKHGFPLRIWIPNRFGMKQPKWIERITVTDTDESGYWVERGWSKTAFVKMTSVIDTVETPFEAEDGQTYVPVGGIAYSGDRGISRVEVKVNDGEWEEAQIREPLSDTTWVIWRYEWPFEAGRHRFAVRCYDGDGELQILQTMDNRPDGATGIHSVTETVSES